MKDFELQEIKDYWAEKYPAIFISLSGNEDGTKFYGRMSIKEESIDLAADTIGELIGQGENFLRKVTKV
jgi:hypothetical protein